MQLTKRDLAILAILQKDAGIPMADLAEKVGASLSSVQRNVQRLRDTKVILRDVSLVDPARIAPSISFLVELELEKDKPALLGSLHHWIAHAPEVQQAWCITGRGDYALVVIINSIESFDKWSAQMMVQNPNIRKFTTSVVLKNIKRTLELPI